MQLNLRLCVCIYQLNLTMTGGFVSLLRVKVCGCGALTPVSNRGSRAVQHQAHGTSLGAVLATGAAGSGAYALAGHVDHR